MIGSNDPSQPRRFLFTAARKFLLESSASRQPDPADDFPRLTLSALERIRMSRSRDRNSVLPGAQCGLT